MAGWSRRQAAGAGLRGALAGLLALCCSGLAHADPGGQCSARVRPSVDEPTGCEERPPPHSDEVPDVASLKTPESPAFMLLGAAPTEIQRPTTPTGLKAALASGVAGARRLGPFDAFAVEFTPFWLWPHPGLDYDRVLEEPGWSWLRNASISLATATGEEGLAEVGLGLRTTLWPGTPTAGARACRRTLETILDRSAKERGRALVAFRAEWEAEHPRPAVPDLGCMPDGGAVNRQDPEAVAAFAAAAEACARQREAAASALGDFATWQREQEDATRAFESTWREEHPLDDPRIGRCLADLHARKGVMAEVATAIGAALPDGDLRRLEEGGSGTWASWLTVGWVAEDLFGRGWEGSLLAAVRVERKRGSLEVHTLRLAREDLGLRGAFAHDRFGLALEGTVRLEREQGRLVEAGAEMVDPERLLWRIGVTVDYHLRSGIWLTATFGKDFGETEDALPLLALANLQWNFDLERGVQADREATR